MLPFLKRKLSKKDKKLAELRALQITLAVLLGLLLAGLVAVWQMGKDEGRRNEMKQTAEQSGTNQPTPPNSKKIGGPFTLTDQDGKTVTDASYRGKYLLIYFGYTYCPDLCPTGLQSMAHALDKLGDDAAKLQPIFITIDPARDTSAKLKEYDATFHPQIVGLTGTPPQIAAVAREYQVYYAKGEKVDDNDYMMDHSSLIYLMGPNGEFVSTFAEDADPNAIVKALRDKWAQTKP